MQVSIQGIGMLAPGLEGWNDSRPILEGAMRFKTGPNPDPDAALLPPNERRRSSESVRWAVQVAHEAIEQSGLQPRNVATVFASSDGEYAVLDRLCCALATPERVMSPTLFHQSVHNTPAGYWGIATTCQQSSTALSCYDDSFAMGLLEAGAYVCAEQCPVLLVAVDLTPPFSLYEARPIPSGFAMALVLTPPASRHLGNCHLRLDGSHDTPVTNMSDGTLERIRSSNPAARSLPVLVALAGEAERRISLDLLGDQRLLVDVVPCRH